MILQYHFDNSNRRERRGTQRAGKCVRCSCVPQRFNKNEKQQGKKYGIK